MKAKVCIPMLLILITCVAYGTWSWAGATAWCAKYDDGWGIAHGSVGWGGMESGSWATSAAIAGQYASGGGAVQNSGGGSSHLEGFTNTAGAYGMIEGIGNDNNSYADSDSDSF